MTDTITPPQAPDAPPATVGTTPVGPAQWGDTRAPIYRHLPGEHGMPTGSINPRPNARPETICGPTDDSQGVETYDGTLGVSRQFVDLHERAVGQTRWNNDIVAKFSGLGQTPGNVADARFCSGTLISEDLFLTAAHCFEQGGNWRFPTVNGQRVSPAEAAKLQHVEFNYQRAADGSLQPVSSYPILELVEHRLGGLDFAIVRLGGAPGRDFGWAVVSTADPVIGEMLTVIGHPSALPKRIEAGPLSSVRGNALIYNSLDTQGGNSGSGVLGADGLVKGVHVAGGCELVTPPGEGNEGVRIEAILAQSPTIRALACQPFGAASIAALHWVRAPMAAEQWLYTLTGNAVIHIRGNGQTFRRLQVCVNVPIPDLPRDRALRLNHWAPSVSLGAIGNGGVSTDEGYAVDEFRLAYRPGRRVTSVDLLVRVAVRDVDADLFRIPFRITLSGPIV